MTTTVVVSWSGGKDSMLALHTLWCEPFAYKVHGLLTTYCEANRRVAIHGTPLELIQAQARSLGLMLHAVSLPPQCSNIEYEMRLSRSFESLRSRGISHVVFGDLFLEEIRDFREKLCERQGMTPLFPVWGMPPGEVVPRLIAMGYRSIICSVLAPFLDMEWLGSELDHRFLQSLPAGIDMAGENGEYHSLVVDGPRFQWPVDYRIEGIRHEGNYRQCEFVIAR